MRAYIQCWRDFLQDRAKNMAGLDKGRENCIMLWIDSDENGLLSVIR
jgi:hypothetical protein